ncbi:MAG: chemotaxis protein CheW [Thermodesulfobacteriota bacterium]
MKEIMVFRVGDHPFGLDLIHIRGVYRSGDLQSVDSEAADSPAYRLEGRRVALFDLPRALVADGARSDAFRRVILMDTRGRSAALGVNQIERVINVEPDHIVPLPPVFTGKSRKWFPGVVMGPDRLIPLLDPDTLLNGGAAESEPVRRLQFRIREEKVAEQMLDGIRKGVAAAMEGEIDRLKRTLASAESDKTGKG